MATSPRTVLSWVAALLLCFQSAAQVGAIKGKNGRGSDATRGTRMNFLPASENFLKYFPPSFSGNQAFFDCMGRAQAQWTLGVLH